MSACALLLQLSPTLCNPMDCSLPGSSVHGILQARILEWVDISFSNVSLVTADLSWLPSPLFLLSSYQGSLPLSSFVSSRSWCALIPQGVLTGWGTQVGYWNPCIYLLEECTGNRRRSEARLDWVSKHPCVPSKFHQYPFFFHPEGPCCWPWPDHVKPALLVE